MMQPTQTKEIHDGVQKIYQFHNGYGASVVQHRFSYGYARGLWEVAVLDRWDKLCYDTPITNDVLGYLSEEKVEKVLQEISNLPDAPK